MKCFEPVQTFFIIAIQRMAKRTFIQQRKVATLHIKVLHIYYSNLTLFLYSKGAPHIHFFNDLGVWESSER